jgi:NAD dependent epimerase/dehydratase family enzyme
MSGRIILAGGSGFLGQSLATYLSAKGFECVTLSRSTQVRKDCAHWDGATVGDWAQHLEGAAAIINLTGVA